MQPPNSVEFGLGRNQEFSEVSLGTSLWVVTDEVRGKKYIVHICVAIIQRCRFTVDLMNQIVKSYLKHVKT